MVGKFGPPKSKLANPAAPRILTAQEAENVLTAPDANTDDEAESTNDSDTEAESDQDVIDEVFGTEDDEENTDEEADEPSDEIEDKPTKPATVAQE